MVDCSVCGRSSGRLVYSIASEGEGVPTPVAGCDCQLGRSSLFRRVTICVMARPPVNTRRRGQRVRACFPLWTRCRCSFLMRIASDLCPLTVASTRCGCFPFPPCQKTDGIPAHVLRLAGIYGPGRSALDSVARYVSFRCARLAIVALKRVCMVLWCHERGEVGAANRGYLRKSMCATVSLHYPEHLVLVARLSR